MCKHSRSIREYFLFVCTVDLVLHAPVALKKQRALLLQALESLNTKGFAPLAVGLP